MSDRNLVLKLLPGSLELIVDIAVSDGVKDPLEEHFGSCAFDLLNHQLFLLEVLLVTRGLAPAFPGFELYDFVLSLGVHDSEFHTKENLLFEPHVGELSLGITQGTVACKSPRKVCGEPAQEPGLL